MGIKFIKELIKRDGLAYFKKIVEKNRRLLEEHDRKEKERKEKQQSKS